MIKKIRKFKSWKNEISSQLEVFEQIFEKKGRINLFFVPFQEFVIFNKKAENFFEVQKKVHEKRKILIFLLLEQLNEKIFESQEKIFNFKIKKAVGDKIVFHVFKERKREIAQLKYLQSLLQKYLKNAFQELKILCNLV